MRIEGLAPRRYAESVALPKEPRADNGPLRQGPETRKTLRVLIIEDDEDDALLVVGELERCGWEVAWERVDTREAMAEALDRSDFDLIVSDYRMPSFRAPDADRKSTRLHSSHLVISY